MVRLYKSVFGEVKDVDAKQGIVTGYFSVFGNKDSDGDIIVPGAFKKTLMENGPESEGKRIKHLLQHDTDRPLSKPHVLKETSYGLYFESKISNTSYGRDTLILYEDGVIDEHSIGYQVIKNDEKTDGNHLLELKLWEGSTVTWGANSLARVTGMKGEVTQEIFDDLMKKMQSFERALKSPLTDETIREFEYRIKQLQAIIMSLAEGLKPGNTTLPKKEPTISVEEAMGLIKQNVKWTKKN